jgi:hypothetical protein
MRESHEEEQARLAAGKAAIAGTLCPLFEKFDPESLISLTPDNMLDGACLRHYDCVIQDAAEAMFFEGGKRLSIDGLAYILALAQHIHYGEWSKPMRVYSVHYRMAEALHPLLPEVSLVSKCNECAVRWSCSLEADGPDFEPCLKHRI